MLLLTGSGSFLRLNMASIAINGMLAPKYKRKEEKSRSKFEDLVKIINQPHRKPVLLIAVAKISLLTCSNWHSIITTGLFAPQSMHTLEEGCSIKRKRSRISSFFMNRCIHEKHMHGKRGTLCFLRFPSHLGTPIHDSLQICRLRKINSQQSLYLP